MAAPDISCSICSADLLLAGDERVGDEVFCTYCGSPYRIKRVPSADSEYEVEEEEV
jgi:DNA-directed RNA polymerase subunit RPC12/RpoP